MATPNLIGPSGVRDTSYITTGSLAISESGPNSDTPIPKASPGSPTSGQSLDVPYPTPDTEGAVTGAPTMGDVTAPYAAASGTIGAIDTTVTGAYDDKGIAEGLELKEGKEYVTPESTVAYQLEQIMSKDSALMQRAASIGKGMAGALGLQSSTAGIGMVAGQLYDKALQIATPDAATYAKAQQLQQQGEINQAQTQLEGRVSAKLAEQSANLDAQKMRLQATFDSVLKGADAESSATLQKWMQEYDHFSRMGQIEAQGMIDKALQDDRLSYSEAETGKSHMMSLVASTNVAIENILMNPDLLQLGPEAITAALNNVISAGVASMKYAGSLYGIPTADMNKYVDMISYEPPVVETPTWSTTWETAWEDWNSYEGVPAPPNVDKNKWKNEAFRKDWVRNNPNKFTDTGRPKWY